MRPEGCVGRITITGCAGRITIAGCADPMQTEQEAPGRCDHFDKPAYKSIR
jgi:hypothetical protein